MRIRTWDLTRKIIHFQKRNYLQNDSKKYYQWKFLVVSEQKTPFEWREGFWRGSVSAGTFQSPSSFFNHINSWKKSNEIKTGKRNLLTMPLIFMPTYTVKLLMNWGLMINAKLMGIRTWDHYLWVSYFWSNLWKLDAIALRTWAIFIFKFVSIKKDDI